MKNDPENGVIFREGLTFENLKSVFLFYSTYMRKKGQEFPIFNFHFFFQFPLFRPIPFCWFSGIGLISISNWTYFLTSLYNLLEQLIISLYIWLRTYFTATSLSTQLLFGGRNLWQVVKLARVIDSVSVCYVCSNYIQFNFAVCSRYQLITKHHKEATRRSLFFWPVCSLLLSSICKAIGISEFQRQILADY